MTLIPRQHLRPLHLKALLRKTLRSQWGERRIVDVYIVDIGIGENLRLPWVEAVADEIGNELVLRWAARASSSLRSCWRATGSVALQAGVHTLPIAGLPEIGKFCPRTGEASDAQQPGINRRGAAG